MSRSSALLERARLLATHGGTLSMLMERLAELYGEHTLVEAPDGIGLAGGARVLSYRTAARVVARASAVIRARVPAGRPVVVQGANGYGLLLACLAAARAGRVFVPINPQMRDDEVAHVVADADGDLIDLAWLEAELSGSVPPVPPAAVSGGDDVAAILYTSGTTGKPKGAMLTHRGLLEQPSRTLLLPVLTPQEMVFALPIAHIMGFEILLSQACAGIPVFALSRFRPTDVLDAIERRRSTLFAGVPAMYRMMLDAGAEQRNLRSIRLWISSADVMPEALVRKFQKMGSSTRVPLLNRSVGEATFIDGYGMVELSGLVAAKVSLPYMPSSFGDFLGFPLPPFRIQVIDEAGNQVAPGETGEVAVFGPGVLRGYHGNEAATRATRTGDGGVRTGDLARRSRFGLIQFVGRKKEVIKHGGYSVFPAEIEETLRGHPAVADAAVVGRPDAIKGEVPVAFVELAPGAVVEADVLRAWAAERMAEYKTPQTVRIMDLLPRTGTGKVARQQLRAMVAEEKKG